ncbi:MAG TPA: DUF6475 domain-containing protein [Phycisphaerae bacterium]|nr:DUF6475 domain-containing protein [Phycisphaerae bacterium]
MKPEQATRFATAISALVVTFSKEASEALFEGYRIGLEGVPVEAVEHAVARALRECKFMPLPAELRELAGILSPADRAIKAWDIFTRAISVHGCYTSVNFDDPVINATIRNLGGWVPVLIEMEEQGDTWVRKNFERIYKSLASTGITNSQALALCGIHEQNNVGRTDWQPDVKLIETGLPPHRAGILPLAHEREERPAIEYAESIGQLPDRRFQ